mmetsp:Transcript_25787/g.61080  ORF Transcript_25787/g.61080 Transcript_25787/m.61080 type:complete len:115 (-) Transcript_25787:326-670(-)|eukprot:CAMPEP_0113457572 /NCGR_PEP_ID=MMETSP0014_2-20120614/9478_1 /TAXON_ID=2857 /ORGANISM="Nitzschia sp." /LENGTH=114 /DNA_ID=CAMNT_0000349073 /DNA_START=76 /DNA_END=420 /DNA_ORIENTATION=+ /assembly_acc=CAM_ASM_000159
MSLSSSSSPPNASGGLKGFLQRASSSFLKAFDASKEYGSLFAHYGGQVGIFLASTSMVVLMPLIFEINREVMMIGSERLQVAELRNQGHSDRQLQEMGFNEVSLHSPSVASMKK